MKLPISKLDPNLLHWLYEITQLKEGNILTKGKWKKKNEAKMKRSKDYFGFNYYFIDGWIIFILLSINFEQSNSGVFGQPEKSGFFGSEATKNSSDYWRCLIGGSLLAQWNQMSLKWAIKIKSKRT